MEHGHTSHNRNFSYAHRNTMGWLGGQAMVDSAVHTDVWHERFFDIKTNTTEMRSHRCLVVVHGVPNPEACTSLGFNSTVAGDDRATNA